MPWGPKGPDAVFMFGQEFCERCSLYSTKKQEFYRRVDGALAQVAIFPNGYPSTSEQSTSTISMKRKELVQHK
jgi:hypothetical protein